MSSSKKIWLSGLILLMAGALWAMLATPLLNAQLPPAWVARGHFSTIMLEGRWLVWTAPDDGDSSRIGVYDLEKHELVNLANSNGNVIALQGDEILLRRPVTITTPTTDTYTVLNLVNGLERVIISEAERLRWAGETWQFWREGYPQGCPFGQNCFDSYACGSALFGKNLLTGETRPLGTYGPGEMRLGHTDQLLFVNRGKAACDIKAFALPVGVIDLQTFDYRQITRFEAGDAWQTYPVASVGRTVAYNTKGKFMGVLRLWPGQPTQVVLIAQGHARGLIGENILLYAPFGPGHLNLIVADLQTGAAQQIITNQWVVQAGGDAAHVFWTTQGLEGERILFVKPIELRPPVTPVFSGSPAPTYPPELLNFPKPPPIWLTTTPYPTLTPTPTWDPRIPTPTRWPTVTWSPPPTAYPAPPMPTRVVVRPYP
jgi:hypothetical protein